MEAINDDAILDNLSLCPSTKHRANGDSKSHHKRHETNKRCKRLPWNCEILRDRFTPQPYAIQLIEHFLEEPYGPNILIFAQNQTLKQYLILACLKQQQHENESSEGGGVKKKLCVLVTHMGSCVSTQVELISRHTTMKLAGIDKALPNQALDFYQQLKRDAELIIISVNHLLEWFSRGLLGTDELGLVIFDHVTASLHTDTYKQLMDLMMGTSTSTTKTGACRLVGLGCLDISMGGDAEAIREHIESLKKLFKSDVVETATDLLDTHNIFNGFEPTEVIEICEDEKCAITNEFTFKLIQKIKESFMFFDEFNSTISGLNIFSCDLMIYFYLRRC